MSYSELHWEGGPPRDLDDESDVYVEDPDVELGVVLEVDPDRWGR